MKRSRAADGSGASNSSKKKAIAIAIRNRRRFPPSDFGTAYFRRGAPITTNTFGPSWREANAEQREQRRASGYVGRGGYWGRAIGSMFGMGDLGDKLGDIGGAALRKFGMSKYVDAANAAANVMQGSGAYDAVEHNSLVRSLSSGRPAFEVPSFSVSEDGAKVVVSHREYLGDVYGPSTSNFTNTSYQLNPGIVSSFPWLSQIASNYDEYDLKQCMFTYRSTTTDIGSSTNGQCGTIIMATQYNAGAEPFSDKESMMQYDGAMSSKTTEHNVHGVECDPAKLSGAPGKYIRTGPVLVGQDLKSYDHAQFNIAVTNIPAGYQGQSLGELWISYTVVLRKPRFWAARGYDTVRDVYVNPFNGIGAGPAVNTGFVPSTGAATQLTGYYNNLGTSLDTVNNRIILPNNLAGAFRVMIKGSANGAPITTGAAGVTFTGSANVTGIADLYGLASGSDSPFQVFCVISGGDFCIVCDFNVVARSGSITGPSFIQLTQTGAWNAAAYWQTLFIDIQQLNTSFNYNRTGTLVLQNSAEQIVVP